MKICDAPNACYEATIQLHGPVVNVDIPDDFPLKRDRDYTNAYRVAMVLKNPPATLPRFAPDVQRLIDHVLGPDTEVVEGEIMSLHAVDADSFEKVNNDGLYDLHHPRGMGKHTQRNPDGSFEIDRGLSFIFWLRQGDRLLCHHGFEERRYRVVRDTFAAMQEEGEGIRALTGALVRE